MNKITLTLRYDDDSPSPFEFDDQWEFIPFDRDHVRSKERENYFEVSNKENVPRTIGLRRQLQTGTAFGLTGDNQIGWHPSIESRRGSFTQPQPKGLLFWKDKLKHFPKKYDDRWDYAVAVIKAYNSWLNGERFGYRIEGDGAEDSCWGFDDLDYMFGEIIFHVPSKDSLLKRLHVTGDKDLVSHWYEWRADHEPRIILTEPPWQPDRTARRQRRILKLKVD